MSRYLLRIPAGPGNPRNSEGSFALLRNGQILFAYTRFSGGDHDDSKADIVARRSHDGGRSWDRNDRILVGSTEAGQNVMSVSLARLSNGKLALVYLVKHGLHDCRPHLRLSDDDGTTWSPARCLIPSPGYYVVNNDRLIVLSDGSLLLPAAKHGVLRHANGAVSLDPVGRSLVLMGSADAASWRPCEPDFPGQVGVGMQEPGVIALPDGTWWLWARGDQGWQWQSFSADRGQTWTPPTASPFASPCSPLSMRQLGDGRLVAVWNQPDGRAMPSSWGRTPLVWAVSTDGRAWSKPTAIEDDPDNGFCYIAIFPHGIGALLAYCVGGKNGTSPLSGLVVRRLHIP